MDAGPPVAFDFGGVLALCRQLWALADDLEVYTKARAAALQAALEDWRGPEATTMVNEVWPAESLNLATGVNQLRNGALGWAASWAEAQRQYNNLEYSQALKAEQDSRSLGESFVDGLLGQDDSAKQVPAPADSANPEAPGFHPGTGFASYVQHAHSDWTVWYLTADGPGGGVGAGGGGGAW
jgi:hypothetical protein